MQNEAMPWKSWSATDFANSCWVWCKICIYPATPYCNHICFKFSDSHTLYVDILWRKIMHMFHFLSYGFLGLVLLSFFF